MQKWVRGYARAIGHTTSVVAKLWALRDGINLCVDLNLTNVLIEMDAKIVVDLLLKGEEKTHGNDVLIADCKEGLKKIQRVQIQHCYREANKCVDTLVRKGVLLSQDSVVFYLISVALFTKKKKRMQKCNLVTTYQKTMNMSKSCTNLFQPCQNYSIIIGGVKKL